MKKPKYVIAAIMLVVGVCGILLLSPHDKKVWQSIGRTETQYADFLIERGTLTKIECLTNQRSGPLYVGEIEVDVLGEFEYFPTFFKDSVENYQVGNTVEVQCLQVKSGAVSHWTRFVISKKNK